MKKKNVSYVDLASWVIEKEIRSNGLSSEVTAGSFGDELVFSNCKVINEEPVWEMKRYNKKQCHRLLNKAYSKDQTFLEAFLEDLYKDSIDSSEE